MVLDDSNNKGSIHMRGRDALQRFYKDGYETTVKKYKYKIAKTKEEEPVIPSPDIFNFDVPDNSSSSSSSSTLSRTSTNFRLPLASECATHLELLEVFYVLRQRILRSPEIDAAMGIKPNRETKTGHNGDTKTFKDDKLWERRQAKWPKFVEFAVVRFLEWRRTLNLEKVAQDQFYLPPLDVLMVWHSFMLNPRLYQETCKGEPLYKMRMPWQKVHESIDNNEWNYNHHPDAAKYFETSTGLAPDLLAQFSNWAAAESSTSDANASSSSPSSSASTITATSSTPTPKTPLLTAYTLEVPEQPNQPPSNPPSQAQTTPTTTPSSQIVAPPLKYTHLFHTTPHPLSLLLHAAVLRQTAFIDKMNAHLWIRSPSLAGTLRRALSRYTNFLKLLRLYPSSTIVPTLDIDLVWHTHQCLSGVVYAKGMVETVGRFVNHDDSIVRGRLDEGFKRTRGWWRVRFGGEYRVCGCWDCEGLGNGVEGVALDGEGKGEGELDMGELARKVNERVMYYRFVEFARRKKMPLPVRGDWD